MPSEGLQMRCTGLTCHKLLVVLHPECPGENVGFITWRNAIIGTPSQMAFLVGLQTGLVACLMVVSLLL